MSDARGATARGFSVGRLILGILLGAVGHGLAVGATFVAAAIAEPSPGGGFEDIAAAVGAFLVVEALALIVMVIAVVRWLVKRRYDLAVGMFLGWLAGPIVYAVQRLTG